MSDCGCPEEALNEGTLHDKVQDVESNLAHETTPPSGLLRLPVEIRFQIFENVLRHPFPIHKASWAPWDRLPQTFWSLLLVNKQINDEASVCLLSCNTIRFMISPRGPECTGAPRHIAALDIPQQYVHALRSVNICARYIFWKGRNDWPEMISEVAAFVREVAPRMEALRRLIIFFPAREIALPDTRPSSSTSTPLTLRDTFWQACTYFRAFYGDLVRLQQRKLAERNITLRYRLMVGYSMPLRPNDFYIPSGLPIPCLTESNVAPGRVLAVQDYIRFAHLILQIGEHCRCISHGSVRHKWFDFSLVRSVSDVGQLSLDDINHDQVIAHSPVPEAVRDRLATYVEGEHYVRHLVDGDPSFGFSSQ